MNRSHSTRSGKQNRVAGLTVMVAVAVLFYSAPSLAGTDGGDNNVTFNVEAEGAYGPAPGESKSLAFKFASFRARHKAAELAAEYFSQSRLIQFVDRDRKELIALVADMVRSKHIREYWTTEGTAPVCTVRLTASVRLSDFIDAQLRSINLARQVDSQGYRDEMEPPLPESLKPGQALAKAYWLLHEHEMRRAIIYLDRLTGQYPHWREAYEIKAASLGLQHRFTAMQEALRLACELGSTTACTEGNRDESSGTMKEVEVR